MEILMNNILFRYVKYGIIIFVLLFSSCFKNKKITQNDITDLDVNEKGTIKIIDHKKNKYLGYISLVEKNKGPPNNLWVAGIFVYEKYIISQLCYAYDPVGISVYKNVKNINYNDLKDSNKLYNTYEHYLMGIYDNYLFLLEIGYSPTIRNFKIVDLKTNETIYEGDYIWDIGINFAKPYIIETYVLKDKNIIDTDIFNGGHTYKYIFDKYLLNIKTKEKINSNKQIEIIGD
jgi:hypothetical protein